MIIRLLSQEKCSNIVVEIFVLWRKNRAIQFVSRDRMDHERSLDQATNRNLSLLPSVIPRANFAPGGRQ
jgi:hypothetical protein